MTLTWEVLERRVRSGDHAGVTRLLLDATEAERAAFAAVVERGIKGAGAAGWWLGHVNPAAGYALAVIGTMPTAARAAALLSRRDMRTMWHAVPVDRFLRIAAARGIDWLGDLGTRLARRLPARPDWDSGAWDFAVAVLRAGGAQPPATEGVVRGWLLRLMEPGPHLRHAPLPPLSTRLRDDPLLDLLLPPVFEIDGVGSVITSAAWSNAGKPDNPFPGAVAALVSEGRLERKTILAATIDRLVRGDRPHALRPFVLLHDALAPTVDEVAAHTLDYARLLAEGPGPVATPAQRALRALDEARRLDLETLLETSSAVLTRPEKAVAKSQLSWLERVARREPERAGEVVETIAGAFGHPALDIQERALTLVAKHLPRLEPEAVARLAGAASVLSGDLPARAGALFGATVAVARPTGAPALPTPPGPAPMPPPIASAAELAEEVATLVREQSGVRWERVLAALVALHGAGERAALAAALAPVLEREAFHFTESRWNAGSPLVCLGAALRAATATAGHGRTLQHLRRAVRIAWQDGRRGGTGSELSSRPVGVLALRAAEIAVHIDSSMIPMLVATPTRVNGSLDPAVLLDRLAGAEAEGWQPWSFDLEQALLRLPRSAVAGEVMAGAAALTSPAGRQFAQWLAGGGLPDPVSERFTQRTTSSSWDSVVERRVVATLRPSRDGGLRLERQLLTLDPPGKPVYSPDAFAGVEEALAMVLPHHREATAAWALPELAALADEDRRDTGRLLPLLAEGTGPVGPALTTGLAYGLAARQETDRAAAVDAFLTLAAGPDPFAAAVGAALGDLAAG
ncbi:DUF6493 family protein, partial [Actinoplanes sp. NPDC024001]|uniref:DUF6493 family protein n=1 Tax=Actinoplanes sp. NPDC024001 TaxID=3154598 RepID=UPI0033E78861